MPEDWLEDRLREVGRRLDHPDGTGIAEGVRRRLRADRSRRPSLRAVLAAALAVFFLGGAAIAALVIPGVDVQRVPTPPSAPAAGAPEELALGRMVSLDRAREEVGINVLIPRELGRPDAVYVGRRPAGGRVTLVYEPDAELPRDPMTGAGMLVTLFRGETDTAFIGKQVGPDTAVRQVSVEGATGMWIEGAPHAVLYRDARGEVFEDTLRLAGNVLIWQLGELTLRLESKLALDPSLEVAESMA